jgi:hypothetical protein
MIRLAFTGQLRSPYWICFNNSETAEDMEMHPRPVDKFVKRDPGESMLKKDSQLDAACRATSS